MTTMPAPIEEKLLTGEELLALGDIGPCELIDGRIVAMSPTGVGHSVIEFILSRKLGNFVEEHRLGWVMGGEVGLYTRRNPDRVRGADVVFISRQRLPHKPRRGFLEAVPELVVEIMSPNDRWAEVRQKTKEYFALGVEQVWVIDPDSREAWVHRSPLEVTTLSEEDALTGVGILAGFVLPMATLFED